MRGKRHKTEEIIRILREYDSGKTAEVVCREYNIAVSSLHRWKKKYGDMDLQDAKRLKDLEHENGELKKIVAELTLDNRILKDISEKKW